MQQHKTKRPIAEPRDRDDENDMPLPRTRDGRHFQLTDRAMGPFVTEPPHRMRRDR